MPFCDWFSGFVNLDLPDFHDGRIIQIHASGEIDFEVMRPLAVSGSYDDKVIVKSCPVPPAPDWSIFKNVSDWRVYISGNPTKFLQGHNVYGHSDMLGVIRDFIKIVLQKIDVDEFTIARVLRDPIKITRIDITQNYLMKSPSDVSGWLRAASQYMTGKNQKVDNEKTLYVGKNSRRVSVKIYEKAVEMHKHRRTFRLPPETFTRLHDIASKLLRFEVTLRGMKLDDLGCNYLQKVTNSMFEKEYHHTIRKMNLPDNLKVVQSRVDNLPPAYVGVYHKWLNNVDLKSQLSRTAYYRYRKFFLETFSIDLSMPPRDVTYEEIIPLWRVISVDTEYNPSLDDENLYIPILKSVGDD